MLKEQRHQGILKLVQENTIIKVAELTELLDVSDMTIRRDLMELEQKGLLKRIHGGARANSDTKELLELSHTEKQKINIEKKIEVAQKIVKCIDDNDVIFLGPGTTIELVPELLSQKNLKVITNSLPVFNQLYEKKDYEIILIGGNYRKRTGAFVGGVANSSIKTLKTAKAFIGVNGIYDNIVTNSNEDEGLTQKLILDNSIEKYIIADSSKFNVLDFYHFYDLNNITGLITDSHISEDDIEKYSKYANILHLE